MIKRFWEVITGRARRMERDAIVADIEALEQRVSAIEALIELEKKSGGRGPQWETL